MRGLGNINSLHKRIKGSPQKTACLIQYRAVYGVFHRQHLPLENGSKVVKGIKKVGPSISVNLSYRK